jgi:hypothetical protein
LIASGPSRFDYSLPQNQYCGHREIFELVSAHFSLLKKKRGAGAGITVRRIILAARRDYGSPPQLIELIIGFVDVSCHAMRCSRVMRLPVATDTLGSPQLVDR